MLEFWVDPESPYHKKIWADESKEFILFCGAGWRSALAAKTLQDMGMTNVAHIDGGYEAWVNAGAPTETLEERKAKAVIARMSKPCPCGRLDAKKQALAYVSCCGQYLDGELTAPDAESLMRSRYSAFVLEKADYLLSTWHSSHRPATLDFEPSVKWLGLQVQNHSGD